MLTFDLAHAARSTASFNNYTVTIPISPGKNQFLTALKVAFTTCMYLFGIKYVSKITHCICNTDKFFILIFFPRFSHCFSHSGGENRETEYAASSFFRSVRVLG